MATATITKSITSGTALSLFAFTSVPKSTDTLLPDTSLTCAVRTTLSRSPWLLLTSLDAAMLATPLDTNWKRVASSKDSVSTLPRMVPSGMVTCTSNHTVLPMLYSSLAAVDASVRLATVITGSASVTAAGPFCTAGSVR